MQIEEIPVNQIRDNPYQTRKSIAKEPLKVLTRSIIKRGLINPITILKQDDFYYIVNGHRRFEAIKSLKFETISCIVKLRNDNNELMFDLVHENLVREDLTPIEKGESIKLLFSQIKNTKNDVDRMLSLINAVKNYNRRGVFPKYSKERTKGLTIDDGIMAQDILKSIGVSENNAYTYLTIIKLPRYIQEKICYKRQNGEFKEGVSVMVGEQLARIKDSSYQKYIFDRVVKNSYKVRQIQALADDFVKKVEEGKWEGFVKNKHSSNKMKDDLVLMEKLSEECSSVSKKIVSFRTCSFLKLDFTLEKNLFVSYMNGLKKEIDLLRNNINDKLADRGFKKINKDFEFEVKITNGKSSTKYERRWNLPISITKELNLPNKTIKLKLKVVGVEEIDG